MTKTLEEIAVYAAARAAHEANRAYCAATGDLSQVVWDDAPEWQRDSAIKGAGLAQDPDTQPEDSHKGWLAQKGRDGWVYGEVKDPEKKTHPCILPYDELPLVQRLKDDLFLAVARATYSAVVRGLGSTAED